MYSQSPHTMIYGKVILFCIQPYSVLIRQNTVQRKPVFTVVLCSVFNIRFLMLLKAINALEKTYGLALDREPWLIQKSNKVIGTCNLSLKIKETIYSFDWVAFIRFSRFNSITIFSNINILFPFLTFQQIFRFECSIGFNPTNSIKPTI